MNRSFHGTGVALATPFTDDLAIDYAGLEKLLEHVANGGVDYLVVMGTTAESPTLSSKEKLDVLHFVKKNNINGLPIVYGLGGNNTAQLIEAYSSFEEDVDAFLSASPYYNKPSQEGIRKHYESIADVSNRPIILYNVPGRTSSNIEAQTTIALASHPNIIGTKEASGSIIQCTEIVQATSDEFLLISGDDVLTVPLMSVGAVGVISVIANALPRDFSNMVRQAQSNQYDLASSIAQQMVHVNDLVTREGNPTGIKAALEVLGICSSNVRLPLTSASVDLREKLKSLIVPVPK